MPCGVRRAAPGRNGHAATAIACPRAGRPAETRRGVLRQTAPCWTTVALMPAAAARVGGVSATQGAFVPRQGRQGGAATPAASSRACVPAATPCQWPYRNAARSFSSNRARQGRRRQRSLPRRHAPMALPQRGAQLFVEPRQAGREAPAKPAASPRVNGPAAMLRANGLAAAQRAAFRRTAPGREGGASEARRVATRQWPYRNAARSFSSNRALLEVRRR